MTWFSDVAGSQAKIGFRSATPVALVTVASCGLGFWLMMSGLDREISRNLIAWTNGRSGFAAFIDEFSTLHEVKGVIAALVIWWLWFRRSGEAAIASRIQATALIGVVMIAIAIGRLTANMLPYRPRPFVDPRVVGDLVQENAFLQDWSSFPSDHAMIFGAFAVAVIRIVPRVGWWLLILHVILMVSLPRVLVGKHYASDVLVGLAVGAALGWLLFPHLVRSIAAGWGRVPEDWRRAEFGYPLLFLVTYEIATNFDGARRILRWLVKALF